MKSIRFFWECREAAMTGAPLPDAPTVRDDAGAAVVDEENTGEDDEESPPPVEMGGPTTDSHQVARAGEEQGDLHGWIVAMVREAPDGVSIVELACRLSMYNMRQIQDAVSLLESRGELFLDAFIVRKSTTGAVNGSHYVELV